MTVTQRILFGGSVVDALPVGATEYSAISHVSVWDADEHDRKGVIPANGRISLLRVNTTAAPGTGDSYIFTVRISEADSALTVTVADAATTASDTTHFVDVTAGQRISMKCVGSAGADAAAATWALLFHGAVSGEAIVISGSSDQLQTDTGVALVGGAGNSVAISDTESYRWPNDATITAFYVSLSAALAVGQAVTLSIYKNASIEASSSIAFVAGEQHKSVSGLTVDAAPGDRFMIGSVIGLGSPTVICGWGVKYTSDVEGESVIGAMSADNPPTGTATEYQYFCGEQISTGALWDGTEANRTVLANGATGCPTWTLTDLRGWISAAPGAGDTRTYRTQVNSADGASLAVFGAADTTATDGTNTDAIAAGVTLSLQATGTGTPAAVADSSWAATMFMTPVDPPGGGNAPRAMYHYRRRRV